MLLRKIPILFLVISIFIFGSVVYAWPSPFFPPPPPDPWGGNGVGPNCSQEGQTMITSHECSFELTPGIVHDGSYFVYWACSGGRWVSTETSRCY